ncbi:MAG: ABC transporter permease [Lachnospiraceae bacterium]|jgi:rhamnose transport system permease protein|nr:ABC transporter permease [Lachnospiraceae bacterium]
MKMRELSLIFVLVLLIAVVSIINPAFFTIENLLEVLKNNVVTLIPTLGMLMVLLIGGIDISIASTMALAGMAVGLLFKYNMISSTFLGIVIALAIGAVCGLLMGVIIGLGNVPPIIATMGGMYIFRALAYLVGNSQWAGAEALGTYKEFALKDILGVNVTIWITILCYIIFFILLKWTKFGRNIYAVGSNAEAAEISGIKVARVKIAVYTIMGLLCGLTGALNTSIYASAQPNSLTGKEMDVIAACVIGGVSMSGGRGSVGGALLGGLVLAVIAKALPLVHIPSIAQNTIKGVLIVVVIIVNVLTQRAMNRRALARREM